MGGRARSHPLSSLSSVVTMTSRVAPSPPSYCLVHRPHCRSYLCCLSEGAMAALPPLLPSRRRGCGKIPLVVVVVLHRDNDASSCPPPSCCVFNCLLPAQKVKRYLINHLIIMILSRQCFVFLFHQGTEQLHQGDRNNSTLTYYC